MATRTSRTCRARAFSASRSSPGSWTYTRRRLQLQERLTSQIAERLVDELDPRGVVVMIEAEHLCMTMRGVQKPVSYTRTSVVRGIFREKAEARAEALELLRAA